MDEAPDDVMGAVALKRTAAEIVADAELGVTARQQIATSPRARGAGPVRQGRGGGGQSSGAQ
eukprot:2861724-Lingulodinium_polyedra.AAC.1